MMKEKEYVNEYAKSILEELEKADLLTWFDENILDIDFVVDSSLNYHGAHVLVTYGGPTAYINTEKSTVDVYTLSAETHLPIINHDIIGAIDDCMEYEYKARLEMINL